MSITPLNPETNVSTELKLIPRAVRERWPIRNRAAVVNKVEQLVQNDDPKVAVQAARTIAMLDGLNLKERELDIKAAPTVRATGNLTQEQLEIEIKRKMAELGDLPEGFISSFVKEKSNSLEKLIEPEERPEETLIPEEKTEEKTEERENDGQDENR